MTEVVAGCREPGAVTKDDLMAFADGDAPANVIEHVRSCRACVVQARSLARDQRQLRIVLNRFECPSSHTLGEYALRVLAPHEQRLVGAHAVDCPRCSEELQTLRSFLTVEPEPTPTVAERLRRVIATLVMPQRGIPVFAELRGSETAAMPLTYRAGDVTVSLSVDIDDPQAGSERWVVSGLITREGGVAPSSERIHLISSSGEARETGADTLGNFLYEAVQPGSYRLEVALTNQLVVIEELRIGGG